ncbi:MAG: helix-turn-helix domain-containing protein [Mycobacteriaceae bacterium]|nr:helix-turn-helix domain-containing protein [Mycobacteriaceae bacterium]
MIRTPTTLINLLRRRRAALGMSLPALARRSGVSEPTVNRIFGGRLGAASFANVEAVARALGVSLAPDESNVAHACRTQARQKAEHIARLVQGTSALEGQAIDAATYNRLVEKSYRELLAGPRRRLWAA